MTFDCGGEFVLQLSSSKTINAPTTIDGGGLITLDGVDATALLSIQFGEALTLTNITLQRATSYAVNNVWGTLVLDAVTATHTTGSAVQSSGSSSSLTIHDSYFAHNYPGGDGSAIKNTDGTVLISASSFVSNAVFSHGGAIYSDGGQVTIEDSTFLSNSVRNVGGGAIYTFGSTSVIVRDSSFISNTAQPDYGDGGAFNCGSQTDLHISGSRFERNSALGGFGGAIQMHLGATLHVTDSVFSENRADVGGAVAVNNDAVVSLLRSQFLQNTALDQGGAVDLAPGGYMTVVDSSFVSNHALGDGGGALALTSEWGTRSHVRILRSAFLDNTAATYGGALWNYSFLDAANVTLSGNSAGSSGGGLWANEATTVTNSTIADNSASSGRQVFNADSQIALVNTIVHGDAAQNCASLSGPPIVEGVTGSNLEGPSGASSCGFDRPSADPLLAEPSDNGGPTWTRALESGSPAIDTADGATCLAPPVSGLDQRGKSRPVDGDENGSAICDVGAFELQIAKADIAVAKHVVPTEAEVGETVTYTIRVTNTGDLSLTVSAIDDRLGSLWTSSPLDAGQAMLTRTVELMQAADLPGPVVNTVTAVGTPATGATVTATAQASVLLGECLAVDPGASETTLVTSTAGGLVVAMPPSALPPTSAFLRYTSLGQAPLHHPGAGWSVAAVFTLELLDATGTPVDAPTFSPPLTATAAYSQTVVERAAIDEQRLLAYVYQATDGWQPITNAMGDATADCFRFPLAHLSEFAIMSEPQRVYLPLVLR